MELDIAHGDIKPENFLIEEAEQGVLNTSLADFGSAVIKGQRRLPTWTEPWNAPELQRLLQEIDFDMMQQADFYSVGLLCIHIMLPLEYLYNLNLCFFRRPEQTDHDWLQFLQDMENRKKASEDPALSERLLEIVKTSPIPSQHRDILQVIVSSVIEPTAGHRYIPWSQIKIFLEEPNRYDI